MTHPSILEKLQACNSDAEIWWDSSPLVFPGWHAQQLDRAPDRATRQRWEAQLDRFLVIEDPTRSLVRGVTTNPSLIAKSILDNPEFWSDELRNMSRFQRECDVATMSRQIYLEAARKAAEAMMPMWRASQKKYGWVSGQLDPRDMFDVDLMMEQAMQLSRQSPNLMVKVPGTRQGYEVIRRLAARGISVNNTFSYTVPQFLACIEAVEAGLCEARKRGIDVSGWRGVITHMIGRFGSQGDLVEEAEARGISLSQSDVRWAEIAILKRIQKILAKRPEPIKMLLSSLMTDTATQGRATLSMHLEETAGADIAYTCKPEFIAELMQREGELEAFDPQAIDRDPPASVMEKLLKLPYFRQGYEPDGMTSDGFANQGPFVATHAEVHRWMRRLTDFTERQLFALADHSRPRLLQAAE